MKSFDRKLNEDRKTARVVHKHSVRESFDEDLGIPQFLARLAGKDRLKYIPVNTPIRHHCD